MDMATATCDVCDSPMATGLADWHHVCTGCGFERSSLRPHINHNNPINEAEREAALGPIRRHNFDVMLGWLSSKTGVGKASVLDVGCAHGWFLERAQGKFDVVGIEPDEVVARKTLEKGLPVRVGFFPEALTSKDRFDLIVFNDVLEHIPNVRQVLEACRAKLNDGGSVVVNAPDQRGIFYRLSKVFATLGRTRSFSRMWQEGLPSPHVYYFSTASIRSLAESSGLKLIDQIALPSIVSKGLFERIHCTGGTSKLRSAIITAGILALLPIIKASPSDISVWLLRKT